MLLIISKAQMSVESDLFDQLGVEFGGYFVFYQVNFSRYYVICYLFGRSVVVKVSYLEN